MSSCVSEWLVSRSIFRKWEDKIGLISILISILIYPFDKELLFISIGLLFFGFLMIYNFYSSKKKWMESRLKSKINNKSVTIFFEENQITSDGPFTEMIGQWDFFNQAIETKNGIFLIPENGISIYFQKKSFDNQLDVKRIVEKINKS